MQPFQNGHLYPVIDKDRCTGCGLCRRACPVQSFVERRLPLMTYASYMKNNTEKKKSTSGGIASVLSSHMIHNGGVVYGCSVSHRLKAEHIRVAANDQLYRLCGSKYIQSRMGQVYKQIKQDLQNQKRVLFIGTPCQVAALNCYLKDKTGLITVDLICHGVPSQKLFDQYVAEILRGKRATHVSFRSKDGYRLTLMNEQSTVYSAAYRKDLFLTGFLKNLFFRESCYTCPYASKERVSDITLGDFWGLGKLEKIPYPEDRKISVDLLNTASGSDFFHACSPELNSEERNYSEAVAGNLHLRVPSQKNPHYYSFQKRMLSENFMQAARQSLRFHMIKNKLLYMLGK